MGHLGEDDATRLETWFIHLDVYPVLMFSAEGMKPKMGLNPVFQSRPWEHFRDAQTLEIRIIGSRNHMKSCQILICWFCCVMIPVKFINPLNQDQVNVRWTVSGRTLATGWWHPKGQGDVTMYAEFWCPAVQWHPFFGATCQNTSGVCMSGVNLARNLWVQSRNRHLHRRRTCYDAVLIDMLISGCHSNIHFNFHKIGCVWFRSLKFLPTPWIFEKPFYSPSISGLQVVQDLSTDQTPRILS